MFRRLLRCLSQLIDPKPTRGRFDDGRMYEISPKGGMRLVLEDELTRKILSDKIAKFHDDFKRAQPHMYDAYGRFIGGTLK